MHNIAPDSMALTKKKFDKLYRLAEDLLDRGTLDSYDAAINAGSAILAVLDGLAYDDDAGDIEEVFQEELDFDEDR
jgi:hypothetical protein